jgi:DNA repair protein RecN (Recombination protein N)
MLCSLIIRDFVIIDRLDVEFASGFSVLTGETGAGKSILIDALSLALGERADAQAVRPGAKQAEVSAQFEIDGRDTVARWLQEQALEGDGEQCLLRRIVDAGGRSRAFINGHPATVAQLRALGEHLVDIHGQHAHQSLLRAQTQRELLDGFAGAARLGADVAEAFRAWTALKARHEAALRDAQAMRTEREALGWKVAELTRLGFAAEAWAALVAEHGRLAHAVSLIDAVSAAIGALREDERAAGPLIGMAITRIQRVIEHDAGLRDVLDVMESARIELDEAVSALARYRSKLEVDPRRLAECEQRIATVHEVCRKYRINTDQLPDELARASARLAEIEHDLDLTRLEGEIAALERNFRDSAAELTQRRRKAARELSAEVSARLKELALSGGSFRVLLEKLAQPAAFGLEQVEFQIAGHAGAEAGTLAKVASGGELSRVSLAIQSVLSRVASVPTLIFDEVDAGIGGGVAETVGQMLRRLGDRHQVMCVTHLAQVAACAEHHFSVEKVAEAGRVASRVDLLSGQQRVRELARMLGGIKMTRATLEHAAELLRNALKA